MASFNNNIIISFETRLCKVDGKLGYFHTWEHHSEPILENTGTSAEPKATLSQVYGIVEFPDGVKRVQPYQIQFCDDQNAFLYKMAEYEKGENKYGEDII